MPLTPALLGSVPCSGLAATAFPAGFTAMLFLSVLVQALLLFRRAVTTPLSLALLSSNLRSSRRPVRAPGAMRPGFVDLRRRLWSFVDKLGDRHFGRSVVSREPLPIGRSVKDVHGTMTNSGFLRNPAVSGVDATVRRAGAIPSLLSSRPSERRARPTGPAVAQNLGGSRGRPLFASWRACRRSQRLQQVGPPARSPSRTEMRRRATHELTYRCFDKSVVKSCDDHDGAGGREQQQSCT